MTYAPLDGVRVVEISHMIFGPSCGLFLAQLGAEVIKVEPLTGDKTRDLRGMGSGFFTMFNRGKKSVALDFNSDEGRDAFHRLMSTADVFIENFKDSTIAGLGLDSATISEKYPNLIICAHKGFLSGPYEARPALDEVVQMMGGLAYMTGSREQPIRVGTSMTDILGGLFGAFGVVSALFGRKHGAPGTEIRVGLFEACVFSVAQHMIQYEMTGVPTPPMQQRTHAWPVYDIFDTADGGRLFVGLTTGGTWKAFCEHFGLTELLEDPGLQTTNDRVEARSRIVQVVAARLIQESTKDLETILSQLSVPFAPIRAPHELYDDPHVQRPGGLVEVTNVDGRILRTPTLPIEFNHHALMGGCEIPALGQHTSEILHELYLKEGSTKGIM